MLWVNYYIQRILLKHTVKENILSRYSIIDTSLYFLAYVCILGIPWVGVGKMDYPLIDK